MDFEKAFDKVPLDLLIEKFQSFGIYGNLLKWLNSYLTNRQQRAVLEGKRFWSYIKCRNKCNVILDLMHFNGKTRILLICSIVFSNVQKKYTLF